MTDWKGPFNPLHPAVGKLLDVAREEEAAASVEVDQTGAYTAKPSDVERDAAERHEKMQLAELTGQRVDHYAEALREVAENQAHDRRRSMTFQSLIEWLQGQNPDRTLGDLASESGETIDRITDALDAAKLLDEQAKALGWDREHRNWRP